MGGAGLGVDERVGLAVIGAALGMADDDGGGAGIGQHLGGDIAGMGAGGERMAILRAEQDGASGQRRQRAWASSVAGGHTMISASGTGSCARRSFSALSSAKEAARPFIFQLPATSGLFTATSPSDRAPPDALFSRCQDLARYRCLAAPRLATYDAAAALGPSSIGRQRGFGKQEWKVQGVALDTLRKGAGRASSASILMGMLVISFAIWGFADIVSRATARRP